MASSRASIFEDSDLDLSGFTPGASAPAAAPEAVRAVTQAANFVSRESKVAKPQAPQRPPRRHRTGRNIQLNLKASQETVDEFYRIADSQGWVLGQTLEQAIAALRRELERRK
jgi:hypothetical protein